MGAWERLGIEPTDDADAIRRAYARALKAIDPEADPDSFVQLRSALQSALAQAAGAPPPPEPPPPPETAVPPEAEPVPLLPRLDEAPLRAMQALLFGGGPEDPEALEAAMHALLADPALVQVELSRQIEALIAQWIVQGTPRSDPMIESAVAHFRWDAAAAGDLHRPRAIEWILQRRQDRLFEADLIAANERKYGSLLLSLRRPPVEAGGLKTWWRAPRVEYLLAYCQQRHPTVLTGLDQDHVGRWDARFAEMRAAGGLIGRIARMRRNLVWQDGLYKNGRPSAAWSGVLVLFVFGMIWLGHASDKAARPPDLRPQIEFLSYTSADGDIDPLLDAAAPGRLRLASLASLNPELHDRLVARWQQARSTSEPLQSFATAVDQMIQNAYRAGLRRGGYPVQSAYWSVKAKKLRWLSGRPAECDAYQRDGARISFPAEFDALDAQVRAAAIMAGGGTGELAPPATYRFSIPHALFAAAARRAGLAGPVMAASLLNGGTPEQRCAARIALVEEALAQPRSVAAPFLRSMSAGL